MVIAFLAVFATFTQAQTSPHPSPSFEVASVRLVGADHGNSFISPPGASQLTITNGSMTLLIVMAFGVDNNQIAAKPGWFDETYYDVKAKPNGSTGLTYEQLRPPLQQLLKQRFGLAVHHETKEVSGYALVVAKGGPKLSAGKESLATAYILSDGLRGASVSMQSLAAMLARPLGRPTVDKTGITGNYDIKLSYAPDGSTESTLPSIFTALQEQLGLRLEPQKVQLDMLVIDHAERVPTEN